MGVRVISDRFCIAAGGRRRRLPYGLTDLPTYRLTDSPSFWSEGHRRRRHLAVLRSRRFSSQGANAEVLEPGQVNVGFHRGFRPQMRASPPGSGGLRRDSMGAPAGTRHSKLRRHSVDRRAPPTRLRRRHDQARRELSEDRAHPPRLVRLSRPAARRVPPATSCTFRSTKCSPRSGVANPGRSSMRSVARLTDSLRPCLLRPIPSARCSSRW